MKDILENIIARKRIEVAQQKEAVSIDHLTEHCIAPKTAVSMKGALAASSTGIIAEFKRRSPSKDWINRTADASRIPASCEGAGAAALSILTDEPFFGGSLKDIRVARPTVALPVLRKDFVIDEYQLYQACAVGADAVLLIASVLSVAECRELTRKAHELGLEVLLEIHSEHELEYVLDGEVDMVGVNNRNLGTFHTEVENSFRMAELLPGEVLKVSESGIDSPDTVSRLREAGYRGFLIGENFMKTDNPGEALQAFIQKLKMP